MRLKLLLRRMRALEAREQLALVPATLRVLLARAALRTLPLRKVLERFDLPVHSGQGCVSLDTRMLRHVRAIERVGHGLFPRSPCLTQAIAVQRLLHNEGLASDLRIGVRKDQGKSLEAHAWVEYQGSVVIGSRGLPSEYIPLPRFSAAMTRRGHPSSTRDATPALSPRTQGQAVEGNPDPTQR